MREELLTNHAGQIIRMDYYLLTNNKAHRPPLTIHYAYQQKHHPTLQDS